MSLAGLNDALIIFKILLYNKGVIAWILSLTEYKYCTRKLVQYIMASFSQIAHVWTRNYRASLDQNCLELSFRCLLSKLCIMMNLSMWDALNNTTIGNKRLTWLFMDCLGSSKCIVSWDGTNYTTNNRVPTHPGKREIPWNFVIHIPGREMSLKI